MIDNEMSKAITMLMICMTIHLTIQADICSLQCLDLPRVSCEICYQKCQNGEKQTKTFKSCKQKECKLSSDSKCNNYLYQYYSEEKCLQNCCSNNQAQLFDNEAYEKCAQTIDDQIRKEKDDEYNSPWSQVQRFVSWVLVCLGLIALPIGLIELIIQIISCVYGDDRACLKICQRIQIRMKILFQKNYVSRPCDYDTVKAMNWKTFNEHQRNSISHGITQSPFNLTNQTKQCFLCKKPQVNCQTSCKHNFHILCLQKQISKKKTCPECKTQDLNPLRIFCENCHQKESSFNIQPLNDGLQKLLNIKKINCDSCLDKIQLQGFSEGQMM